MKTYEELQAEIIRLNAIINKLTAELESAGAALQFITDPLYIL